MNTQRPWKLYLAAEGEPRQLLDTFVTLREAAQACAEIVGARESKLTFKVTVDNGKQVATWQPARFIYDSKPVPYVIELAE